MRKEILIAMAVVFGMTVSTNSFADYKEKQIWKYRTRKGEENSRVYIVKIDQEKGYGKIYHVYIDGLMIQNPHIKGGIQSRLPHAPVDEDTLKNSLTEIVKEGGVMPDISEGYKAWREEFDAGNGGVFNIPLAEIINLIEQTVNKKQ